MSNHSNSHIYLGQIRHRRFFPRKHHFSYSLYMLALDVDEIEADSSGLGVFGKAWFNPLRFVESDYLKAHTKGHAKTAKNHAKNRVTGEPSTLSSRIKNKVSQLSHGKYHHDDINKIVMLVQVRCFGVYFSPANFYFCYDKQGVCIQMLAEVSNTPWNQRYYYLVKMNGQTEKAKNSEDITDKDFHVSPFMDLNMKYHWKVSPPDSLAEKLLIHIENRKEQAGSTSDPTDSKESEKLFDATLTMKKQPFDKKHMFKVWCALPVMTLKIVAGIYWQALKLFTKRIPFVSYQHGSANNTK